MNIEQQIFGKLHNLSESQQYAVLGYIEHLLVDPIQNNPFPLTHVEEGVGCVGYHGARRSLEDMQQGIEAEARRQWQKEKRT